MYLYNVAKELLDIVDGKMINERKFSVIGLRRFIKKQIKQYNSETVVVFAKINKSPKLITITRLGKGRGRYLYMIPQNKVAECDTMVLAMEKYQHLLIYLSHK